VMSSGWVQGRDGSPSISGCLSEDYTCILKVCNEPLVGGWPAEFGVGSRRRPR